MKTHELEPKTTAADLMLLSKEAVAAKCRELNITPTSDKYKMIDRIIVKMFGFDACKKAFARQ